MAAEVQDETPETVEEDLLTVDLNKLTKAQLIDHCKKVYAKFKHDERKRQWGQQFDLWLIRNARRKRALQFFLARDCGSIIGSLEAEADNGMIAGIPIRVDRYEIQIETKEGRELWLNKSFITGCSLLPQE